MLFKKGSAAAALLMTLLLLLCGCSTSPDAAQLLAYQQYPLRAEVCYTRCGRSAAGTLQIDSPDSSSFTFREPQTLEGLTISRSGEDYAILFGDGTSIPCPAAGDLPDLHLLTALFSLSPEELRAFSVSEDASQSAAIFMTEFGELRVLFTGGSSFPSAIEAPDIYLYADLRPTA